jgi:hypothetical protein
MQFIARHANQEFSRVNFRLPVHRFACDALHLLSAPPPTRPSDPPTINDSGMLATAPRLRMVAS